MLRCPTCDARYPPDVRFCALDGARLVGSTPDVPISADARTHGFVPDPDWGEPPPLPPNRFSFHASTTPDGSESERPPRADEVEGIPMTETLPPPAVPDGLRLAEDGRLLPVLPPELSRSRSSRDHRASRASVRREPGAGGRVLAVLVLLVLGVTLGATTFAAVHGMEALHLAIP